MHSHSFDIVLRESLFFTAEVSTAFRDGVNPADKNWFAMEPR